MKKVKKVNRIIKIIMIHLHYKKNKKLRMINKIMMQFQITANLIMKRVMSKLIILYF